MDKLFFAENRKKVIGEMVDGSCLIMFSGSPPVATADEYYHFQPDRNLYYLTGITRPDVLLWIWKHSGTSGAALFLPDGKHSVAGLTDFPLSKEEAKEISGLENVNDVDAFNTLVSRHIERMSCETVYFDFTRLHIDAAQTPLEVYAEEFGIKYPGIKIGDIHKTICNFRVYKTKEEIAEIRKAADITKAGVISMMKNCRPSINERDLEAEFMYQLYKNGEPLPAFASIVASGKNALIGHYSANDKKIEDDVFVQLDVGAQSNWYTSDVSRVIPSNGKFNDRQTTMYKICYDAMDKLIAYIKPGVTMKQTIEYGSAFIREELDKMGINDENTKGLYIYCGFNHFVGLNVHDVGDRYMPLAPGMVLAIDSAMGIPDEEFSFRIEDDLLITESGNEVLTVGIPKTIEDIEKTFNINQN
ncbi:MAG: M24 family metallopeptidase [Spirochaetales bacterium]|jgi:Xaa-Pro aminopeptidase|nr:M24 family metallopeptidase [Spirochaetales bacterium]